MENPVAAIWTMLPTILVAGAAIAALIVLDKLLLRRTKASSGREGNLPRQLMLLAVTGMAVVFVVLTLPVADSTRNQLLALFGLALTALIALSSTTFVANAMAGIMLRSVNNFRPGDFLRVSEHFGRVTERGLFHTELQTEDSDLTTLPNLLLVSTPVTVVRAQGTIVSATVSLGYDKSHTELEPIFFEAATAAQLEKPYVHVIELADHAVTYRVAGFLPDVKLLLTARSNLRKSLLDRLHAAQIEIASPRFVNQRLFRPDELVIPDSTAPTAPTEAISSAGPEDIAFEKADAAEHEEGLRKTSDQLKEQIETLEESLKSADQAEKPRFQRQLAGLQAELESAQTTLARIEKES